MDMTLMIMDCLIFRQFHSFIPYFIDFIPNEYFYIFIQKEKEEIFNNIHFFFTLIYHFLYYYD